MQKLQYSITINVAKEKVWHTMLDDATYRQWTEVFSPNSYFEGSWDKGSKISFLDGSGQGMVSRIEENRPYEFISIEHLGIISNGQEDTTSDAVKGWSGAHENYTFREKDPPSHKATDGQAVQTEVLVEMDTEPEHKAMFEQMWPEALQRLKDIAEGRAPKTIIVSTMVNAPMAVVWEYWNQPEHIVQWAFASDDWEAPEAENDLRVGGKFKTIMATKDKSSSFDFTGSYTTIKEHELIEYDMDDGRHVKVQFNQFPDGVHVTEAFEPEQINPKDLQKAGWQAILDNFKRYVERKK